jgi:hypothetical protein
MTCQGCGSRLDIREWEDLVSFLAKHVRDHLDHGQFIVHQEDLRH